MGARELSEIRKRILKERRQRIGRLEALLYAGSPVQFGRDQTILPPASSPRGMLFIEDGIAAVSSHQTSYIDVGHIPVHRYGVVLFGEDEVGQALSSCFALTGVTGTFVPLREVNRVSSENSDINQALLEIVQSQYSNIFNQFAIAASATVRNRLLEFFRDYLINLEPEDEGFAYPWGPSQQGLSRLCCTTRSHVSVVLGGIRNSDIARIEGGKLVIPEDSELNQV